MLLKLSVITLPLLFAIPSFAQVSWGVDLHFGTPPPRHEVIVERPYPDAIWVPGYYNYYPGHRYAWNRGFWRRNERFEDHRGYSNHDRFERRDGDRDRRDFRADEGHDRGGDHSDVQRGRIR
ncbi:MAG: hypothetical protein ACHQM6_07870 [Candidatus Kapaibacterium sp.]